MDNQESRIGDKAPPGTLSFFEQYELISNSSFFSADFYLRKYKDVAGLGLDPVAHYLKHGAAEGRDPHEQFDTAHYLEQCAMRGLETGNPLVHFLTEGRELGISPKRDISRRDEQWVEKRDNAAQAELDKVRQSGLFDWHYYNNACGTSFQSEDEALRHFFFEGYREGRRPNLYFDPAWYLNLYPDVRDAGVQPLYHFVIEGDGEGRQPSRIFDAAWYRCAYAIPENENSLAHYLAHRTTCRFSPLPEFDVEHYGTANQDVRDAGIDAFEHFLFTGYREGRNPSPSFNIRYYAKRYLGGDLEKNPFLHYLDHKHQPGVYGAPPDDEASIPRAVKQFTRPSADFEEFKPIPPSAPRKAKVLAYYLPQFHTFPENDRWWGRGFTEWTNIARGVSRFKGHYQPRIPRDLGFYSLDSIDTLKRQVAMAKGAGIYGFVYYYYYFNGKRLMEKPMEQFLDDPSIDMPFCLLWANENWTRRWDGAESDVLISQDYEPDDDEHVVEGFVHHFKDKRYIRINGRPLLMIYRADTIPEPKKSLIRWRALFKERFNEDPILIIAQFYATNPDKFGFDGAVEFPPHKLAADLPPMYDPPMYEQLELIDIEFTGQIFNYDDVVARSVDEPMPSFPLIKTAVPSWDNDARRQGDGVVLQGSTPAKYQAWLGQLIEKAREKPFFGEHFVCVNAWNEWCEAAYLEPDLYYGSAYLNATGRAVVGAVSGDCKLLLVGHDAWPHGAQHLLVNIARRLKSDCGVQVEFLLLDGGTLEETYRDVAPVTKADGGTLAAKVEGFKMRGFAHAIVNTVAAGLILPHLQNHGIDAICLVHELPRIIREKKFAAGAKAALELSRHAVFPAAVVRDQVAAEVGVEVDDRMLLLPQGMYTQLAEPEDGGAAIREELGIAAGEKLVLGIGYADLRKGFDLFLQLWRHTNHLSKQRVHFCWIGDISQPVRDWLTADIDGAKSTGSFHMPGYRNDVETFLFAADAFVLTSREDPFPTVVHEALGAGLPVLVFDGSGGMPDFLARHRMGTVVPPGDVIAMGKELARLVRGGKRAEDAARRKEFVRTHLDFGDYVRQLLRLAIPQLPAVSVAIPNYNYARFMPARLASVFQQTHPAHEIMVLDDCSSDDSLDVIPEIAREWNRKLTLLPSDANSGSVFAQWRKAAELATGEYLWIAEADDLADPEFLGAVVGAMQADPAICLGFSDSRTIDYDGSPLWDSYKNYYEHDGRGTLATSATFDGDDFVRRHLAVRNLILNVSAVVWRREALLRALDACQEELKTFRMAGDWRLYLEVLTAPGARIAYIADALNVHRRHAESVTHALKADKHVAEIAHCHALGAERLKLPARVRSLQTKYRQTVEDQLKAAPTDKVGSAASKRRRAKPVVSAQLR